MRLTKIKVAGFKSFADPTSVGFPSNLTGVVGPNGCGKSNIIDAVRWVMGELSAKHLRGDSMTDVIFNGSASRKPVGTASVELVFDNSDGKISGPYAEYAEVSLRRQVSRSAGSMSMGPRLNLYTMSATTSPRTRSAPTAAHSFMPCKTSMASRCPAA